MTPGGPTPLDTRIEQCIARGRSLAYITERLGVTEHHVLEVGDRMDALRHYIDDPKRDKVVLHRTVHTHTADHGRVAYRDGCRCETCTDDHATEAREYRARKRAS